MSKEGKRLEQNETAPEAKKKEKWTLKRFWKEWGEVVLILAAVYVVFKFIIQIAWVPSGSMETTLPTKSAMLGWQLPFVVANPVPERGDIVTFWNEELNKVLVKRVIGLPGDEISFSGGSRAEFSRESCREMPPGPRKALPGAGSCGTIIA